MVKIGISRSAPETVQFARLVDRMALGVVYQNAAGAIIYANPAAEEILGQSLDEMQGRTSVDPRWRAIHEDGTDFPGDSHPAMVSLRTGKPVEQVVMGVYHPRRKQYRWILVNARPEFRPGDEHPYQVFATFDDITERHGVEDELRRSNANYRLISDHTDDVIWLMDIESQKFTYVSPSIFKLRGYTPEEVLQQTMAEALTPESQQSALRLLQENLPVFLEKNISPVNRVELDQFRKDGSIVHTEVSSTLAYNEEGKLQVIGISRDITERRQALALQDAVYRIAEAAQTADSLPDLYSLIHRHVASVMDARNFYIALYDETTALMRFVYSQDEIDADILEPIRPDKSLTGHVLRTGKSYLSKIGFETGLDVEFIGADSAVWLGVPLVVHGKTIGVMVVQHYTDPNTYTEREQRILEYVATQVAVVIDRRQAEEEMRLVEKRNRALIENAPDGIVLVNQQRVFIFGSPSAFRMFGYTPQEILGTCSLDRVHPDDLPRVIEVIGQSDANPTQVYTAQYRFLHKNGAYRWIEATYSNLVDEPGVNAMVVNFRDVTYRRQVEQDLQERVNELTCLFAVSRLLENNTISEAFLCGQIIKLLKPAMQYPHLAVPVVVLDGKRTSTDQYTDTLSYCISSVIEVNGKDRGRLSVYYTTEMPYILPEEQELVSNISRMLGLWLERRQSEAALRASDERFRQLAENIGEVFWMAEAASGRVIYVSPAYQLIWGRSDQSLYQNPHEYAESILPEDRPVLLDALQRQTRGETTEIEYRILRPDNVICWIWDRSFPIFDETGKLVRIAGVATDITDVRSAQRELEALNRDLEKRVEERTAEVRQSEVTYRALFENSNDGIFLMTPDGFDLMANQQALDMIGYSWDEYLAVSQKQKNALTPLDQQLDADEKFAIAIRGERVPLYERTLTAKDGHRVEVEINLSPIRDDQGKIILVQSVVRDVTERKKAQLALQKSRDELRAANASLEKASRMKDEFLASMSHELRTPLTGVLGLSEALQLETYGPLNERQSTALKNIEDSGRHLLDLINDILDLSKIEAQKLELQMDLCSVTDIVQSSLQITRGMAQQKRQVVGYSTTLASAEVRADPRRLKQMLVNLLSNAVKFTPEGGSLGVEVSGSEAEGVIAISVWDKGIGIKAEDLERLFKPFVQLDSRLSREHSGTGLGLSLVARLAEMHGGSVGVESQSGAGSRFTISLPWAAREDQARAGEGVHGLHVKRCLIVEDNELHQKQIGDYLQHLKIEYTVYERGNGAVELAASLQPDVILLDLGLPDIAGADVLLELKRDARTKDIPVVISSIEEERVFYKSIGAAGYLVKPFGMQEMLDELHKIPGNPSGAVLEEGTGPIRGTILLADDNEVILETVSDFLRSRSYNVVTARDGRQMVDLAMEVNPDLILADVQMPGTDGLMAMREIRALDHPALARVPIIAMTALAMPGDEELCLRAGANRYISKPVKLEKLVGLIREIMENRG